VGEAAFLYPFLGQEKQPTADVLDEVAASIRMKVRDDARMREQVAHDSAEQIGVAVEAMRERLDRGGKLIMFGNGGSATDANDWALDCVLPPASYQPVAAVSLSMEPANLTAIANDIGTEVIFLRQLIAQARPEDMAVAISTSGGSRNVIVALEEAASAAWPRWPCSATMAARSCGRASWISPWWSIRITFPAFRKFRRPSITSSEKTWRRWRMAKLELFGTPNCPYTQEMREWLEFRGREFLEYNVDVDAPARARLKALVGNQRMVPVLVEDEKVVQIGWQGRGCVIAD
jgi:phosphoheptose isomerase/glutaredoxin